MSLSIERVSLADVPWDDLDRSADRTVAQTRPWLAFLAETQRAEIVVARVLDGSETVGWYSGAVVSRAGLRILGSPLRGWTTAAMGFNLKPGVDRAAAVGALPAFAFGPLRCLHLEVADRGLSPAEAAATGLHPDPLPGFELDLGRTEDELLAGMNQMARRNIRKAERNGVRIERVDPATPGDFAPVLHAQLVEAYAKRGGRPRFGPERIDALIRHLGPTGNLLLLRAVAPDGSTAATAAFPGLPGSTAEFWMGSSSRRAQPLLPNELLMWEGVRQWRSLGATRFNLGGGGPYKQKFGGEPHVLQRVHVSRAPIVDRVRELVVDADRWRRLRRARRAPSAPPK